MRIQELWKPLEEYLIWCRGQGCVDKTILHYRGVINLFIKSYPSQSELTSELVVSWFAELRERGRADATIQTYYRTLNTFFCYLVFKKKISPNAHPMNDVKFPRVPMTFRNALSRSAQAALIKVARSKPRDHAIVLLLLDAGPRASELLGIRVMDIDFDERCIEVIKGKGGNSRTLFFSEKTGMALAKLVDGKSRNDYVFSSQRGEVLTVSGLNRVLKRIARRAGVDERVHTHGCRHTFATETSMNNCDPWTLMGLGGWRSLRSVQPYIHRTRKDLKEGHDKYGPLNNLQDDYE